MKNDLVEVTVKHVMPTANGCAVFLGNDAKNFIIYADHFVGGVIQMTLDGAKTDRPLTHDLIGRILLGLGAKIDSVVINDAQEGTFFARLRLAMENELGKKILELDARPSDTIILALQNKRPLFVARAVLDAAEDMTEILERVIKQQEDSESAADNPIENIFPGITDEDLEDDDEDDDEDADEDDDDDDDET